MKLLVLTFLVIILVAFVAALRKMKGRSGSDQWPFYAKRPLSSPEQVLYHRLVKALPEHIVARGLLIGQVVIAIHVQIRHQYAAQLS